MVLRLADISANCSTRERGRQVYPALAELFRTAMACNEEMVVSFKGVELVTPSFLDETIIQVVIEEVKGSITLAHIRDFPVQSLRRMLELTGKKIELREQRKGVYQVVAA